MKTKNENKLIVKEVEVIINEKTLTFKNELGNEVTLDRQMGMSDYRIVYNYLKLKNKDKEKDVFSVGNFNYKLDENNNVTIYSTNYNFENVFEFTNEEQEDNNWRQHLRNKVIKFLLENID